MAARRRILVVDDDPHVCELIADILEQADIETICAGTDRRAYEALDREGPFEGIVVDINLGIGTTGFDIARAARAKTPDVQVVFVSGEADERSFRAFGVENSRFLFKPFGVGEMLQALGVRRAMTGEDAGPAANV